MKFLTSCHDVQTHLTEYLDGTLPWRSRLAIRVHLLLCRVCAGFLRGLKALPGLSKVLLAPPRETPEAAARALEETLAKLRKPKLD
jgi:anti-sigma factor ChrR (cupin superfamily)